MSDRRRDSVKARRICFETHRFTDHLGRVMMMCHLGKHPIDPVRDRWRADHIRRFAHDGEDSPENLWPICEKCDREIKAPNDTREVAKGKRASDFHFGIKRRGSSFATNRNGRWRKKLNGEVVER